MVDSNGEQGDGNGSETEGLSMEVHDENSDAGFDVLAAKKMRRQAKKGCTKGGKRKVEDDQTMAGEDKV